MDDAPFSEPESTNWADITLDLGLTVETESLPRFDRPLTVTCREARLLNDAPWVRVLGKLGMEVTTEGWKFPTPVMDRPIKPAASEEPAIVIPLNHFEQRKANPPNLVRDILRRAEAAERDRR